MISLAIAYLRDRPLTTALNVLLLAISVAMLVLLLQLGSQAGERFERDARGVDLVVGAKGSPLQLILSSVFHVDQPTGNIPYSSLALLRRDPAVARAVPLALGDNFEGFRIVGTDETFADLYKTKLAQGRSFDAPLEAVLGASVAAQTGAELGQKFIGSHGLQNEEGSDQGHDHAAFVTVGILEPTGTVVDRIILTSYETVWDVHGIDHDHEDEGDHEGHDHEDDHDHDGDEHDHEGEDHDHDNDDDAHDHEKETAAGLTEGSGSGPEILQSETNGLEQELTALLVTYRNASGAIRIPSLINRQTEMQSAVPAAETARLLELLGASLDGVRLFAWLLALTGGLAIFVALLNMARSREGDLALLRVMGATRVQVFATLIMEGVMTAALGAVLGWLLAHSLIMVAKSSFSTLADLGLQAWLVHPGEALLVMAVLAIGGLAALIPAWRVFNLDPARVLARS
ncbi:MAG: FtsX-like permease family protein [Pseudomonadota bacterium]